jgi:branched-chain amino acid transport system ATP-binding protein
MGEALAVSGISRSFDGFQAIRSVSFSVQPGTINAIIGPNGAGKTTLFNLITGLDAVDEGEIAFEGKSITGVPPAQRCRMGIGRSFQRTNIFPSLTVFQNVQAAIVSHRNNIWRFWRGIGDSFRSEATDLLAAVGLQDRVDAVASSLAHGDRKQLDLAVALALEPRLLLLDEPTAGMSVVETERCIALIERLARERDLVLLFTEHDMKAVFAIADRILVMHHGEIIADGTPEAVKANPLVRATYLGESA